MRAAVDAGGASPAAERLATPISVVLPAYNAAAYIGAAIAAIQAQTVAVAEIIVVDDGSTDATVAIARALGATVLEQQNSGVSVARNRGIAAASQPWIALIDADDLWERDKLERQWRALAAAPGAAFSFCDFSQFDEKRVRNASVLREVHRHFDLVERTPIGDRASICESRTLISALLVQNVIQPSALVVAREAALALGGFDRNLLACQDYDFVMRLARDYVGIFIDLPLVHYRRHAAATTSNFPKSREGLAGVALRAITHPWAYSPETVDHFSHILPDLFWKCGFAHLRFGQPARAREWFRRSLRERFSLSGAVLYLLTFGVETQGGSWLRDRLAARRLRSARRLP